MPLQHHDDWKGLSADVIDRFVDVVAFERRLPRRTRRGYRAMLCALDRWMQGATGHTLMAARTADLQAYCSERIAAGIGPRLLDRVLVGMRHFYAWARACGCRDDDPAASLPDWMRLESICDPRACAAAHNPAVTHPQGRTGMQPVLEDQLRRACDARELQVYYQPKFHLSTGGLRGVEALLRWRTGGGTWIAPSTFVPLLEEMDLIGEVGTWLFERAAEDAAWWRGRGLDIGRVAINVSPLQLRCKDFLSWVLSICDTWNSRGTGIDIELTESTLLPDPGCMVSAMDALTAANVRFAIDDFGMGYSSLDLLLKLPVRYLKIDRSFVAHMLTNCKAMMLVEAIIRMAHEIGLEAIAEGVETEEQLRRLQQLGCDIGQGHYFHPALDRDDLLACLQPGPPAPRHGVVVENRREPVCPQWPAAAT